MKIDFTRIDKDSDRRLIADAQSILCAAALYHQKVLGAVACETQAEHELSKCPKEFPYSQKYTFLVDVDGARVGIVDLLRGYPEARYAYLGLLLFAEGSQRRGFGVRVYSLVERLIQNWSEVSRVRLGVAETNDVIGFWQKMGFERTGRIKPCAQPEVACRIIEMEKAVTRES